MKKLEKTSKTKNRIESFRFRCLCWRGRGKDRYTRCDTLKGDYIEQAIRERIAGTRTVEPRRASPRKPDSKVGLLVDIEAVIWLKEHSDMSYEDLQKKSDAVTASFNALSVQIKELGSQMAANGELQKQIANYAKTRAVYVEYRKAGYSKKFRAAHETEILLHQAAKKHFDGLGITKLSSVKSLREEYAGLLEQKRKAYSAYKQARAGTAEGHAEVTAIGFLLFSVFSVPTERAAITAGDDFRGLGTCHQQAFSRNSGNENPAKYAILRKIALLAGM